jgi:hypothetical protein
MKKARPKQSPMEWRVTLRSGMVPPGHPKVKVFTSATAFGGYVSALRAFDVIVSFSSPFVAICQDTK